MVWVGGDADRGAGSMDGVATAVRGSVSQVQGPESPIRWCPGMKKASDPFVHKESEAFNLAETEGFEPSVRGYRTQHFECCTFGRSDTSPDLNTLSEEWSTAKTRGLRGRMEP